MGIQKEGKTFSWGDSERRNKGNIETEEKGGNCRGNSMSKDTEVEKLAPKNLL